MPAHLHQLTELALFKSALTKYLLTIPDTPPVVGYRVNSNSMLDWSINKAVTVRVVSTDGLVEDPRTLQRYQRYKVSSKVSISTVPK